MRLATLRTARGPRLAAQRGEEWIDLNLANLDIPATLRGLLNAGDGALMAARRAVDDPKAPTVETGTIRFLAPMPDPQKIVCLGLNYRDHAAEGGVPIPKDPVLFSKYATALIGHGEAIVLPPVSKEVDYEAELVVVIGKRGRDIAPEAGLEHVAGYTIGHDVSARDWQLTKDGRQWMAGKTFDTFAPTGPVLVTADEVPDPQALPIRLRLNGQTMQESNTREMIFPVAFVVAYLSQIFTLEPGDLIFTGTPSGVGMSRKPPVFLKAGDVVEGSTPGASGTV